MTGLPNTHRGGDVIWVVVYILDKSAYFIPIKIKFLSQKLGEIYISVIMKPYGIPFNIVSNRDPRFTFMFWESL